MAADDPDLIGRLRLALVPGVGPRLRLALLEAFGSPAAVFSARPEELRQVQGIGRELSDAIVAAKSIPVHETLAVCAEHGIALLTDVEESYPRLLKETHTPPGVLFMRGQLLPQDSVAVAVVGTRHATQYGLRQAERRRRGWGRAGFAAGSGWARGIDGAAHRGALAAAHRAMCDAGRNRS